MNLLSNRGNVLGRRKLAVRVCSCPKRDKEKEEKEHKESNQPAPSHGRKRRSTAVPKSHDLENNIMNSDDRIIEMPSVRYYLILVYFSRHYWNICLQFRVMGHSTAELILTTARNKMFYDINATPMDEAKRTKMKEFLDEITNIYSKFH